VSAENRSVSGVKFDRVVVQAGYATAGGHDGFQYGGRFSLRTGQSHSLGIEAYHLPAGSSYEVRGRADYFFTLRDVLGIDKFRFGLFGAAGVRDEGVSLRSGICWGPRNALLDPVFELAVGTDQTDGRFGLGVGFSVGLAITE
jgi:hypothetical protein